MFRFFPNWPEILQSFKRPNYFISGKQLQRLQQGQIWLIWPFLRPKGNPAALVLCMGNALAT